jgi:hypothetical protein
MLRLFGNKLGFPLSGLCSAFFFLENLLTSFGGRSQGKFSGFLSGRSSVIDLSLTVEDLRVEVDLSDILALALVPFFIYVQHFFKEVHILLEE